MPNIAGKSGTLYAFEKYPLDWNTFGNTYAVYIYARPTATFSSELCGVAGLCSETIKHPYCYIGETNELKRRMDEHRTGNDDGRHQCALTHGASHLLVHLLPAPPLPDVFWDPKALVKAIEKDLLDAYTTPCNKKNN